MTIRCFLIALALLLIPVSAQAEEPIKIGAVFSATGPASFLGEPEKNTVIMLADQINEAGGVLGRKLEVVVYDDETDVNKCVLAVDKLLKKDRVVTVLGPSVSGNTLAVMNKFPAAKVPMLSCAAAEKIVNPLNPWVFKTPQSDRHAVTRILEHAQNEGYKNIAIITVSDGYGQAGRTVLQELVPEMGFTLMADEVYGPKDTDMTAQLTSIKGAQPDAIICWGTNPGPAVIAKNRVQLGIKTPLYMSHGVASKKFIELAGNAAEGLLLPAGRLIVADQIPDDHPQKPVVTNYIEDYESRFDQPISSFGGYAWDALMLTVKAIEMGNSADPQDIRDNLEKIEGFVGTGGIFNFSAEDHNGLDASAFEMVIIENGDWKIVE
ncbi:ABC transporter substrate-binding protein [Oceanidesulfovibrio indonesiensis]|uniref:ABC transporter substrate-binding protein n=1 Tax=Oceanidesulfovibrio indonesiensis TaxID=54767 RepID=A0A7M3MDH2_9BACT|nr:ABC transporter substrate-binding protein [Oceanidesulfovibrio indonesiensis]TVM16172.1 ABC transporter substrate-binding protein [Oceanidesulfovibrio indonesiensis]